MPRYEFQIPTCGTETFHVEAETPEKAAEILAASKEPNILMVESSTDWDTEFTPENLVNYIEREF